MTRAITLMLFVVVFLASTAHAAVIKIDGTVKSVDAKKRTITVETGKKSKTLDVSSKVKINIEGNRL